VFLLPAAKGALDPALVLARSLRRRAVGVILDPEPRSFKAKMRMADKLGARFVLILGEDELQKGVWTVRDMKVSQQEAVNQEEILLYLEERLRG
jgi:histidyl-tRNA synthetase